MPIINYYYSSKLFCVNRLQKVTPCLKTWIVMRGKKRRRKKISMSLRTERLRVVRSRVRIIFTNY